MLCPSCDTKHELFGSSERFNSIAKQLGVQVLGELPLVPGVSMSGDGGKPYSLVGGSKTDGKASEWWNGEIEKVASNVWDNLNLQ
jgi:ATP-binding protein involved in chromosome partitioning